MPAKKSEDTETTTKKPRATKATTAATTATPKARATKATTAASPAAPKARATKPTAASAAAKKPRATKATATASTSKSRGRAVTVNGIHDLVIVESPAKARTLQGILGAGYEITASVGHVRDLPKSKLGVDIAADFEPSYIVPREKKQVVAGIKEAASSAQTIYLATDPDREGEAISWHLVAAAGLEGRPMKRVVFHEITPHAIREAFENPRDIDFALVDAQQARRVLDRLVGYQISPLLWKKVRRGLSAGRVQSAAVRMIVDRERQILDFNPKEYWTIDTQLGKQAQPDAATFTARLRGKQGERDYEINTTEVAQEVSAALKQSAYAVSNVRRRDIHRRPAPPFTTSTLQQEASRRFGYTARRTMALAQQLYEGIDVRGAGRVGLITYMRTDSTNLSELALTEIRGYIGQKFGGDFLPTAPRVYKARKGAQEAHEAIRATSVDREPNAAELRALTVDQRKLYTLIWQRGVACQMADAVLDSVSVDVDAAAPTGDVYQLRASASAVRFPGYRALYEEVTEAQADSGQTGDEPAATISAVPLPDLAIGDPLTLIDLKADQHFTEPPPRFTEATLVKELEENGIGRPSTYAPIISTIQDRGYVERENRQLKPTELGFVVNDSWSSSSPTWSTCATRLRWRTSSTRLPRARVPGARPCASSTTRCTRRWRTPPTRRPSSRSGRLCAECEKPRSVARPLGPFFACSGFPECRYTRPDGDQEQETTDEKCDLCGSDMTVKRGRFGTFLACTTYPECKGTKPLLVKTGVPCPVDGGEIVERSTKKGRRFYGCSNYPACDYTSWQRPLQQVCPDCGGLIVADRGRRAHCTKCEWTGPSSQAAERDPNDVVVAPAAPPVTPAATPVAS